MSDDKKQKQTLTDDDMVTSPKLSRRLLLTGAGVALGAATLGAGTAFADEKDNDGDSGDDMDKGGGGEDMDKGDDKDQGGGEDKDRGDQDKDPDDKDEDDNDAGGDDRDSD